MSSLYSRLIVQSFKSRKLSKKEGFAYHYSGYNGIATLAYYTTSSCLRHVKELLMVFALDVIAENNPFLYVIFEWSWEFLELLCLMPLQTVRRRLQLQSSTQTTNTQTVVKLSQKKYVDYLDCFKRIIKEEGLFALYRGFYSRFITSTIQKTTALILNMIDIDEELE